MDYEDKYKEALLEARAVLEPCLKYSKGKVREALDSIDNELKRFESEDERIRMELKEAFEAYDIESKWNGIPVRSIFAWLEKQKEQKSIDLSEMMVHKEPYIAPVPTPMVADEQKPAEYIPDSVKFSEGYKTGREVGFREGVESVKPAEWSEEDEDMIRDIIASIDTKIPASDFQEMENWLKFLPERFNLQPKQEWSEEDDLNCNRIIRFLEPHKTFFPTKETKEDMQNWLKNRLKSLRPSWKPSEDELTKKHLEGYIKGRNDALRKMSDFIESHFNTQSGTSIKSGGNE